MHQRGECNLNQFLKSEYRTKRQRMERKEGEQNNRVTKGTEAEQSSENEIQGVVSNQRWHSL